MTMTSPTSGRTLALALLVSLAACKGKDVARGDSLQTALTDQQKLANQFNSQKDSLTRVVVEQLRSRHSTLLISRSTRARRSSPSLRSRYAERAAGQMRSKSQ